MTTKNLFPPFHLDHYQARVMPTIKDTKAWITIDGKELPEYQVEEEEKGVVKCFIPSQTGKVGSLA